MTTIAFDGITLASDSQVTIGHGVRSPNQFKKIEVFEDEVYYRDDRIIAFAVAGDARAKVAFMDWIAEDAMLPYPEHCKDASILMVGENMSYQLLASDTPIILPRNAKIAIGSGGEFATSAMSLGRDAIDAVKHAIIMDCFSGGDVVSHVCTAAPNE